MIVALFAGTLAVPFDATLESVQRQIRNAEMNLVTGVEAVVHPAEEQHQHFSPTTDALPEHPTEIATTYELIPITADYSYNPVESWMVGISDGHTWTRPPILAYFLLPLQKTRRISIPSIAGRWVSRGIDAVFVFRFGKWTEVSRVIFPPFDAMVCNPRDVVIDGFNGEQWVRLGQFSIPNGTVRYQEFPLRGVRNLRGCRIFALDNYGDPTRTCLSEVRFATRMRL
jgi:hypothetical protein